MKIKRFFAADIRQALRQVRETLGSDAVILSNKAVEGGVELVAAMDYDESVYAAASRNQEEGRSSESKPQVIPYQKQEKPVVQAIPDKPAKRVEWSQDPILLEMRQEIKALRKMMENDLSGLSWGDMGARRPQIQELYRRLMAMGLSPDICNQQMDCSDDGSDPDQIWKRVLYSIAGEINTPDDALLEQGGVVALIGPTGVGKTTTVAKLAARFALRHGHRHLALVSTDSYRIGAQEQLNTYAKILDVPVRTANNSEELSTVLNSLSDKRLVLIDTAGMSQRDLRLSEQLSLLTVAGRQIRSLLTLSAATEQSALEQTIRAFGIARPEACILTKVDEAASLGGAISALIRSRYPLAFTTDGQKVPEDLHLARPHTLVSMAAALGDKSDAEFSEEYLALSMGGARVNAHG